MNLTTSKRPIHRYEELYTYRNTKNLKTSEEV